MKPANPVFPETVVIEDIPVKAFEDTHSLFQRLIHEAGQAGQSLVYYLNVHVANTAFWKKRLKVILQRGDVVYCDGAGIVMASKIMGQPLPTRLTAADWFLEMIQTVSDAGCRVYLLGGEPGVADQAMERLSQNLPQHRVVGVHHGYILKNPALEQQVIDEINALAPDILIVGMGTPVQELWIHQNRHRLTHVSVVYAIGAVMDFLTGRVSRCPSWMGNNGLEWLYRLGTEPKRLFARYVIGNPWFLGRILYSHAKAQMTTLLPREIVPIR